MIAGIGIFGFKSYSAAELILSPMTLLIGANASGKTNCIEALRFLSRLANGQRIDDVIEDIRQNDLIIRGEITNIAYDGVKRGAIPLIEFTIELMPSVEWQALTIGVLMQVDVNLKGRKGAIIFGEQIRRNAKFESKRLYNAMIDSLQDGQYRHEISVRYENFKKKKNHSYLVCSNRQALFTQLDTPSRFETIKSQQIIPAAVIEFQQTLQNIIFLDLNPRAMVDYSFIVDNTLKPDGRNLSSVLFDICETQGRKAEVLEFIGDLPEQQISDVTFLKGPRGEVMVELTETFGNTPTTREAPLLSDGTLRVLAVAAALLSAPVGGLVVIEEIDNGVHPSRARALLATILAASKRRSLRVLLTSHNPALLDTLPKESVPDVVCCYRDPEQGDSRLVRLADLTDYPDLVARGPLGQLMTQGLLDRYLKNQRTPEEKAAQAQEWLRQLQLEDEEEAAA